MIVVSDTSPITNLHAIGGLWILRDLYEVIIIPPTVHQELIIGAERGNHPTLETERDWLKVHPVAVTPSIQFDLSTLDAGEIEAIALAEELGASLLLMDDRAGRRLAESQGLHVMGTLGVLVAAKRAGILSAIRPTLDRPIQGAGFWVSTPLYQQALASVGEDE